MAWLRLRPEQQKAGLSPWGPGEGQQRAVKVRWRCDGLVVERLLDIARPLLRAGMLQMALGGGDVRRVAFQDVVSYPRICCLSACPESSVAGVGWERPSAARLSVHSRSPGGAGPW